MRNAQKVEVLMKIPIPEDLIQLRSLLGGLSNCRKFLHSMAKRIRPITAPLEQGSLFRRYSCHGNHSAETSRRVVLASGPCFP